MLYQLSYASKGKPSIVSAPEARRNALPAHKTRLEITSLEG